MYAADAACDRDGHSAFDHSSAVLYKTAGLQRYVDFIASNLRLMEPSVAFVFQG